MSRPAQRGRDRTSPPGSAPDDPTRRGIPPIAHAAATPRATSGTPACARPNGAAPAPTATLTESIADALLGAIVRRLRAQPELVAEFRAAFGSRDAAGPAETPVYVRVAEYAVRVGLSKRTVETLIRQGLPIAGAGRRRRVPVEEADKWLRAGGAEAAIERRARLDARRSAGHIAPAARGGDGDE